MRRLAFSIVTVAFIAAIAGALAFQPSRIGLLRIGRISTLLLLKANAVVGVTMMFDSGGRPTTMGIQCALCHSTVDDSAAAGIGHRLDGWANRDLNVGAIVAAAPDLSVVAALLSTDQTTV